jgi:hypothetical protein
MHGKGEAQQQGVDLTNAVTLQEQRSFTPTNNGYSNALEMLIQVSNMTSCVILENPLLHLFT